MNYRSLHGYKYQLLEDSTIETKIQEWNIKNKFIVLDEFGTLTVKKWYAWDGPSGPTIDTDAFVKASLAHDALYQLMREKKLPYACRDAVDRLLQQECIKYGMSKFRAAYVYKAVKWFAGSAAKA